MEYTCPPIKSVYLQLTVENWIKSEAVLLGLLLKCSMLRLPCQAVISTLLIVHSVYAVCPVIRAFRSLSTQLAFTLRARSIVVCSCLLGRGSCALSMLRYSFASGMKHVDTQLLESVEKLHFWIGGKHLKKRCVFRIEIIQVVLLKLTTLSCQLSSGYFLDG